MASQRFRSLERGPDAPHGQPPASAETAEPGIAARARSLEREGELQLDESRVIATHVCRACRFENRAELLRCLNCGTPLGGADQEAFDREVHANHAHRLAERHEATTDPPAQPAATSFESATERPEAQGDADEPGLGAVLATGFITAAIFALVSIPVRLIFSRAFGGLFSWRSSAELVLVVAVTAVVYAVYGRQLRRL